MRKNVRRDVDEAWCLICDIFQVGQPFTLRQAVTAVWPDITRNNYGWAVGKIRKLFERASIQIDAVPPQIQKVSGKGIDETWELITCEFV